MRRRSVSKKFTDKQVAIMEQRRQALGLSRTSFRDKFEAALKVVGCNHSSLAAKMRLDRVLHPRMRRSVSETTTMALAQALDWTIAELHAAMAQTIPSPRRGTRIARVPTAGPLNRSSAPQIALAALAELDTHQIALGVDLTKDNLSKVYLAAYRMFQRLRKLAGELSAEEFARDGRTQQVYKAITVILNQSLRPHLTKWPERYEEWRKDFAATGETLSAQKLQQRFPSRAALSRDLKLVSRKLQADAQELLSLILQGSKRVS